MSWRRLLGARVEAAATRKKEKLAAARAAKAEKAANKPKRKGRQLTAEQKAREQAIFKEQQQNRRIAKEQLETQTSLKNAETKVSSRRKRKTAGQKAADIKSRNK